MIFIFVPIRKFATTWANQDIHSKRNSNIGNACSDCTWSTYHSKCLSGDLVNGMLKNIKISSVTVLQHPCLIKHCSPKIHNVGNYHMSDRFIWICRNIGYSNSLVSCNLDWDIVVSCASFAEQLHWRGESFNCCFWDFHLFGYNDLRLHWIQ